VILEARELTVRFPGAPRPALTAVSDGVRQGELLAVVGPNGSGKTTLLRALLGLLSCEHGTAWLKGRPIKEWRRDELARTVGVVSQREEHLFPLRVRDAVMLGRYARLGPVRPEGPGDRSAVDTAMRRCDVDWLDTRLVDTLSGGEWQRVRVARALAQEPEVLVLDEPTAALDVRHEMEIFELVRRLVADGLAGLIITHHLNLASRYADRMLLLVNGTVAARGTPREVLREEVVTQVFGWPVAVQPWHDHSPQIVPLRPEEWP
jgi:iron complex transport system ATP-binding protein